jgi:hypothetical protein
MLSPPEDSAKGDLESASTGAKNRLDNLGSAKVPLLASEEFVADSPSTSVDWRMKTRKVGTSHFFIKGLNLIQTSPNLDIFVI